MQHPKTYPITRGEGDKAESALVDKFTDLGPLKADGWKIDAADKAIRAELAADKAAADAEKAAKKA